MDIKVSFVLILLFIFIYLFFIKLFIILLRITGLTPEKARFQVISMLTNSGFTTQESEIITNDATRRKIAMACMLTGNSLSVIIISLIINLFSNLNPQEEASGVKFAIITLIVFAGIIIIVNVPAIKNLINKGITKLIQKFFLKRGGDNMVSVLDIYNNRNAIAEVHINKLPLVLKDKSLADCDLKNKYNITLLLITRKGRVIDVTRDTIIQSKDSVVVFGKLENIHNLFNDYSKVEKKENLEDVYKIKENNLSLIDNYGKDALIEIEVNWVPPFMYNRPLFETGLRDKYKLNVLTIKRGEEVISVDKDAMIMPKDKIVLYGNYNTIKNIFVYKIYL